MDPEAPPPMRCPPHHWLVVEVADGAQQWTCYRCGAAQRRQGFVEGGAYYRAAHKPPARPAKASD